MTYHLSIARLLISENSLTTEGRWLLSRWMYWLVFEHFTLYSSTSHCPELMKSVGCDLVILCTMKLTIQYLWAALTRLQPHSSLLCLDGLTLDPTCVWLPIHFPVHSRCQYLDWVGIHLLKGYNFSEYKCGWVIVFLRGTSGCWGLFLVQVMLWVFTPRLIQHGGETTATDIVATIIITFLVQYLPKVLHVALVVRRLQHVTGYIFGTASSGFFLNLITYFVAAHVSHDSKLFLILCPSMARFLVTSRMWQKYSMQITFWALL